ncbi:HD domain-containing phosphohydrolase [Vogesella indigofera]|uniref:Response regulator n=1 Tax=Vogesella indigofera TaxID=45465 RepID=A0ABT5I0X9_VOGIN|nr:HD domain-containing phosphohydrolase [Vogesella indigofera]MDC7689808.1 response regulator [Vogesella indigofera]
MKVTVLIVDDNPANLMVLRHLVGRMDNCEPVTMQDGQTALTWCTDNTPDLILTDYMMPGMDGLILIQSLRAMPNIRDIPIIMVTTSDMKAVRQNALESGATDFLTKPVDPAETRARIKNLLQLRRAQRQLREMAAQDLVIRLSHVAESRDPETGLHIERMAYYARIIATRLGLGPEIEERIFLAAPMHDIGKVAIPDHILLKPGKLTPEEFDVMKTHPTRGAEFLQGSELPLLRMAYDIAQGHHEKFDGTGYPQGLQGETIPLAARIVAVADVFDALTSARPYKPAWEVARALDFMESQRGLHFDPQVLDAFLASLEEVLEVHNRLRDG